jgi:predicted DNA-binding ribbon-helix-helix protein
MPEPAATAIAKHSLTITGHRTSVSLEQAFWDALRDIARARGLSLAALIGEIDASRGTANLSSAIRVFVLVQALDGALAQ